MAKRVEKNDAGGVKLKNDVSLLGGVSLILGGIIGSGIFISPKGVLMQTGSLGLSLVIWTACGVLSLAGSLCYAELGTLISKQGGDFVYQHEALGPLVAFTMVWVSITAIRPSGIAVMSLSLAEYATQPLHDACGPPVLMKKLITVACILLVTWLNIRSVKLAANIQIVFTIAKVGALLFIIAGGIYNLANGKGRNLGISKSFEGTSTNASSIALSFYSGLWAYDGWNNLNYAVEELKNPKKNLPRALLIAIPVVTIVYVLTNISYYTAMSVDDVLNADAVAVVWAERTVPSVSWLVTLGVICSVFGSSNASLFTSGRVLFAAGREGQMPDILQMVHVESTTPVPAIIFTSIVGIIMIIPGDIFSLIDFLGFTTWLGYALTMASLLVLRYKRKDDPRPIKVPLVIPVFVLLAACFLVVAPVAQNPSLSFLWAFLFVLSGPVLYFPFIYFKLKVPGLGRVTRFLQMLVQVVPAQAHQD